MRVVAYDPFLTEERALELGVEKVELDELLKRADVITLHVPLTDQTRNILSRENLEKTKKGLILVNCARGGLVDEEAVADLLESGHLAGQPPSTCSPLSRRRRTCCSARRTSSPRRTSAQRRLRHRKTLPFRWLNRCRTICCPAPSPMRSTCRRSRRKKPRASNRLPTLAEKLGSFAGQISDFGYEEVVIEYEGEVADLNRKPLTAALLAGLLRASRGDVNMVSAPAILADSGVKLTETKTEDSPVYDSLIRVKVKTKATAERPGRRLAYAGGHADRWQAAHCRGEGHGAGRRFRSGHALREQPRPAGLHRRARPDAGRGGRSTSLPSTSAGRRQGTRQLP
jgi:D-3-phosphoglycerate dehydrogenase